LAACKYNFIAGAAEATTAPLEKLNSTRNCRSRSRADGVITVPGRAIKTFVPAGIASNADTVTKRSQKSQTRLSMELATTETAGVIVRDNVGRPALSAGFAIVLETGLPTGPAVGPATTLPAGFAMCFTTGLVSVLATVLATGFVSGFVSCFATGFPNALTVDFPVGFSVGRPFGLAVRLP
jgi:hypothetical protein